jgi:hypothetical protein
VATPTEPLKVNVRENSRKGKSVNILPDDGHKEPKHVVE